MPLMQPRATATVLDSAGVRFLTRYKVPLAALEAQDEHALNELLRARKHEVLKPDKGTKPRIYYLV